MFWGKPLVEWHAVTTSTVNRDPEAGSVHSFTVNSDGSFQEINNRVPFLSEPDTITWTELKILDVLVDRINREPIPLEHQIFPPDGSKQDHFLELVNDPDPFEGVHTLFSDNPAATSYAADDKLDFVEIAVLNAYLNYLDHKYDSPLPPVAPPDTVL
jgi:hypothetical protein